MRPAPEPPWAVAVALLHPRALERGYPERPLASLPGDYDPTTPAPNRLIRRLRARHAVWEAAAFGLPQDERPSLALYPRPVPEEDDWADEALAGIQRSPAWQQLVRREVLRHLGGGR